MKTTNGIVTKYVYGLGLIGEEKEGCFKTYHFDYRGSTVAITDECGNVTDTFEYDTYGRLTGRTGSSFVIFGYNGRDGVVTDSNGLIYMRARYYAPELRRFVNADVIAGEISNAVTLNRYAYANGNPVTNVAPFGLSAERGEKSTDYYNGVENRDAWAMPNWLKITIGAVVITGLATATVFTGGATAVIVGAALSGAIVGGASGTVIGAIGGGISGGWQGALDGASSGFMSGTIIGGITGAVSAGFNIATGVTSIAPHGNAHGSTLHKLATNMEAGKMAASGQYSQIGVNKSLKTMGLNGTKRPDVIGVANTGKNKLVEVVSPKQSTNYIENKMSDMISDNPSSAGKIVTWVRNLFR